MRAYVASRETYVTGAQSLGFGARGLPEDQVNRLAYGALQFLKLPGLAVWLFRENVRDYPQSPNLYEPCRSAPRHIAKVTACAGQA